MDDVDRRHSVHARRGAGLPLGSMSNRSPLAGIASLVGDPVRVNLLGALLDGRALTARELALAAGVSPQAANAHLSQLTEGQLLAMERQGRHRYFRLASPLVGQRLESLMATDGPGFARGMRGPIWRGGQALRTARTCYDHLAGRLGVALAEALTRAGHVVLTADGGEVTPSGVVLLCSFGADAGEGKRVFCKPCLDWSERRPHLAGRLGAALASRCLALGWVNRQRDTRAVAITPQGRAGFARTFGVELDQ